MRGIIVAAALGVVVLLIGFSLIVAITQPHDHAQLHNPYWPFTVELAILDR